jgi:hypothetical protein
LDVVQALAFWNGTKSAKLDQSDSQKPNVDFPAWYSRQNDFEDTELTARIQDRGNILEEEK